MTFDQLNYFAAVARYLNFTKAAEHLFISQPTLSRQIALLEEEMGIQLLFRDSRSVRLTYAGEIFLVECSDLLLRGDALRRRMEEMASGQQGTLSIASHDIYAPVLLHSYGAFQKKYPGIELQIMLQYSGLISETVLNCTRDMGVCFDFELTDDMQPDLNICHITRDRFCVITSDRHPFAAKESVTPEELQRERLYFLGRPDYNFVAELWSRAGLNNAIGANMYNPDSIGSIILQVRAGNGASIVPRSVALSAAGGCAVVDIDGIDSDFNIVMISRKSNKNPALKLFTECVANTSQNENRGAVARGITT